MTGRGRGTVASLAAGTVASLAAGAGTGLALGAVAVLALAGCGHSGQQTAALTPGSATAAGPSSQRTARADHAVRGARADHATHAAHTDATPGSPDTGAPYAVGERIVTFVYRSRRIHFPGLAPQPRRLVTVIRYPAIGPASENDLRNAPPARAARPFPLVVFGHGFAVTPAPYARLLRAWARAGYIVAAPIFPLENAGAPGGPDESDLVNQPRDMRFVITRMLAASSDSGDPLAGMVAADRIAVSGQSDGGETALATAYDRHYLDPRVRAALILSGAQIPGVGEFSPRPGSPPLLAVQGTADMINRPRFTAAFFRRAGRPKFLLQLLGAGHLPPYTYEQPQLSIVERVTIAFLDCYLKGQRPAVARMIAAGDKTGRARLIARR